VCTDNLINYRYCTIRTAGMSQLIRYAGSYSIRPHTAPRFSVAWGRMFWPGVSEGLRLSMNILKNYNLIYIYISLYPIISSNFILSHQYKISYLTSTDSGLPVYLDNIYRQRLTCLPGQTYLPLLYYYYFFLFNVLTHLFVFLYNFF